MFCLKDAIVRGVRAPSAKGELTTSAYCWRVANNTLAAHLDLRFDRVDGESGLEWG